MASAQPHRIKTISEFHQFRALPKPEHPLVSIIDFSTMGYSNSDLGVLIVLNLFCISSKQEQG